MRIDVARIEPQRFPELSNGVIELTFSQEACPKPVTSRGARRLDTQRLLEVGNGLAIFAADRAQGSQVAVGSEIGWILFQPALHHCFL